MVNAWSHVERIAGYHNRLSDAESALRFERGGRVFAADGPIGTLQHVVINRELNALKWLVVAPTGTSEGVLVPADLAVSSAGSAVFLGVTQEQFLLGASRSPRYDDTQFSPTSLRSIRHSVAAGLASAGQRVIGDVGGDWLTTRSATGSPAPPSSGASTAPKKRGWQLGRKASGTTTT